MGHWAVALAVATLQVKHNDYCNQEQDEDGYEDARHDGSPMLLDPVRGQSSSTGQTRIRNMC